jgi:hypothetical protein
VTTTGIAIICGTTVILGLLWAAVRIDQHKEK